MRSGKVKTIVRLEHRTNSPSGNPRFTVFFDDGTSAKTKTDAAVNYMIENSNFQGAPVYVEFDERGDVIEVS